MLRLDEKSEMIMRNPRVISAFEQSRLSVVLFVSTHRQGSSKYFLYKEERVKLRLRNRAT
jgi:hypothetical protein